MAHEFIGRKVTYRKEGYALTYEVWEELDNGRFLLVTPLGQEREESEADLRDYFDAPED